MKQMTLSMTGYFDKGKKTRREQFLAEMEGVVPWGRLGALIGPHYPKASKAGARGPIPSYCEFAADRGSNSNDKNEKQIPYRHRIEQWRAPRREGGAQRGTQRDTAGAL